MHVVSIKMPPFSKVGEEASVMLMCGCWLRIKLIRIEKEEHEYAHEFRIQPSCPEHHEPIFVVVRG